MFSFFNIQKAFHIFDPGIVFKLFFQLVSGTTTWKRNLPRQTVVKG